MNASYTADDLIVAPATALTRSALAVIRGSGPKCVETFAPVFSRPEILTQSKGNRVHYGWIVDKEGSPIDEVLVTVFRAPASYTGEDAVEVSCHGGSMAASKILELFHQ
ncbi:MAG: hypothetical protein B0D92_04125 [Spirochaeta sp. LUC14_002_19_P3]|nr:MAG: hypothetical protein B0D92_04125 [Spirochaeta sp. LUC14_002_19_P3]